MARRYYVSQVVQDFTTEPPRTGAMHFATDDEAKARREAAIDPEKRYLLVFEAGVLVETAGKAPAFLVNSAIRKEAQSRQLERAAG